MLESTEKYVRLCKTVNTKGKLVPHQKFGDELFNLLHNDNKSDYYTSIFYFDKDGKEYFEKNDNSIKGFTGRVVSDKLIFDFDSEDNIEAAKEDTRLLLNKLNELGIDVLSTTNVYFSGNKGFHVEVNLNGEVTPEEMKTICKNFAQDLGTLDTQIYNITRLFRVVNTRHQKSGLFKVQLDPKTLKDFTIDKLKQTGSEPKPLALATAEADLKLFDKFKVVAPKPVSVTVDTDDEIEGIRGINSIDYTKCPTHTPRCIYALQNGVMKPGERNAAFLRLANFYRNLGYNKDLALDTLNGVAKLNAKLYPEKDIVSEQELKDTVINTAFAQGSEKYQNPGSAGTSSDNELLQKYCGCIKHDKPCILHGSKTKTTNVVEIGEVSESFSNFAENYDENRVYTGIDFIDKYMHIAVGTTTLLVGACGSGKTTVALNIMEEANRIGQHTMFFSLDMHKNLVYLKLARKLTNYSQEEIFNFYKTKNQTKINEIRDLIKKHYGKTFFDFSAMLSIEEMRDRVKATEQKTGKDIRLVVVDYASRIDGPKSDPYQNAKYNAIKSTEVAGDTNAAWIFISQISRNIGDGSTPLRTKRAAKDSGDWEETATNVITVWRPFMGLEGEDNILRLFLAKNRMGKEIERPLHWSGEKGLIRDMTEEDYAFYTQEREKSEIEVLRRKFNKQS